MNVLLAVLPLLLPPATARAAPADPGIEWVTIPGGTFLMGSDDGDDDEAPRHGVRVSTFQLARTEVTAAQYRKCVAAGACEKPGCTVPGDDHPVACVNWFQARAYAAWAGGRLPSEAEWEYAARSGGRERRYAWGDEAATCEFAVLRSTGAPGCGAGRSWPVCSKPAGRTSQGLCDMAGGVWEWVEDPYHGTYAGAPSVGEVWELRPGEAGERVTRRADEPPERRDRKDYPKKRPREGEPLRPLLRIVRGGAWNYDARAARATFRSDDDPNSSLSNIGFRPARTP